MSSSYILRTRLSEKLQSHLLAGFLPCFSPQVLSGLFLTSLESVLPFAPDSHCPGLYPLYLWAVPSQGSQFPDLFSLLLFMTVTSYHLKCREDQDSILETLVASCSPEPTLFLSQAFKFCWVCSRLLGLYSNKDGPAAGILSALRESA